MSTTRPPAWATAWLSSLLQPRDQETIVGDLLEEYREIILPERGVLRAQLWYFRQIIGFLRETEWFLFAIRTTVAHLLLLILAAFIGPIAAVPVFLVGITLCGFMTARRSGVFWAGMAQGVVVTAVMLSILTALRLPHPPGLATPAFVAITLSTLAAFVGRCTSERIQEIVFPSFTAN